MLHWVYKCSIQLKHTTHLELSEGAMLNEITCFIPYSDCNQSPRNMYQCQVRVCVCVCVCCVHTIPSCPYLLTTDGKTDHGYACTLVPLSHGQQAIQTPGNCLALLGRETPFSLISPLKSFTFQPVPLDSTDTYGEAVLVRPLWN